MIGECSNEVLKKNFDIVLQYRNTVPMEFISLWNGGESWTGHLLIMERGNFSIEKAFALFTFRTLCLFEEWDIDDTFSEEEIKNIFNITISEYDENDIVKKCNIDYFMSQSNYIYLIDSSKENVLTNRSCCHISINNHAIDSSKLNEFDPLKEYMIKECFQVKDKWNSQHYILVTNNEFIYYEGWTNA